MKTLRTAVIGVTAAAGAWTIAHLRSPAVRTWEQSSLPIVTVGPLSCRVGGDTVGPNVLLLHGLVASSDVFGRTPDEIARSARVVAPDLLGFGRSLDEARSDFHTEAQMAAIDGVVDELFDDKPIRIGAHSMGSAIALRWAVANPDRCERVVCVGAPLWESADAAKAALGATGTMGRAFILDESIARRVCHLNCTHRTLAGVLSALGAPRWPIPVARQASLHTWPAYRHTLDDQILHGDWADLLAMLREADIPVDLIWGDNDTIGDPTHARRLAPTGSSTTVTMIGDADHTLPSARPEILVRSLGLPDNA